MRLAATLPLLLVLLCALPAWAQPTQPGIAPAPRPSTDRDEARWAQWEAEARITDGDYDGAVQAAQQAEAERQKAQQADAAAQPARR